MKIEGILSASHLSIITISSEEVKTYLSPNESIHLNVLLSQSSYNGLVLMPLITLERFKGPSEDTFNIVLLDLSEGLSLAETKNKAKTAINVNKTNTIFLSKIIHLT